MIRSAFQHGGLVVPFPLQQSQWHAHVVVEARLAPEPATFHVRGKQADTCAVTARNKCERKESLIRMFSRSGSTGGGAVLLLAKTQGLERLVRVEAIVERHHRVFEFLIGLVAFARI